MEAATITTRRWAGARTTAPCSPVMAIEVNDGDPYVKLQGAGLYRMSPSEAEGFALRLIAAADYARAQGA